MKNLKITTRLAISIMFLVAALLFLAHEYVNTKQTEVHRLQKQMAGIEFLTKVTNTAEVLARYRIALFRIAAGESGFEEEAVAAREAVERAFATLREAYTQYDAMLYFSYEALKERHRTDISIDSIVILWEQAEGEQFREVPHDNYNELFRRMMRLAEHTLETSGLIADSDIAGSALTNTILHHVTEVIMRTLGEESDGYEYVVRREPIPRQLQLSSWDYGTFIRRDNLRLVQLGIEISDYHEPQGNSALKVLYETTQEALQRYLLYGNDYAAIRIRMGEEGTVEHDRYITAGGGFHRAMYDLWYAGSTQLYYMVSQRLQLALEVMNRTVLLTLLAILLALGFFVYVAQGIVRQLKEVEMAMNRVANGELDIDIPHLERGDEIGSMARTLERFRNSYWWLRD